MNSQHYLKNTSEHKLSEEVNRKFIESFDVSDWEIETEDGFVDINQIQKTIQYEVYEIVLDNATSLKCADTHILIDENYNEVFAIDSLHKSIRTKFGISKVISVKSLGYSENMYDLSIDSDKKTYYTNNILSHNTTALAAAIIHYVTFNDEKTVALLANKGDTAREILNRIQFSYENLPDYFQHGIIEYNKGSMVLENKCRIIASSTSGNAIRGFSISYLYIDECAFVENWEEFYQSVYPTISSGKETKIVFTSCVPKNTLVFTDMGLKYVRDFVDDTKSGGYIVPDYNIQGHTKLRSSNIFHNNGYKNTKILKTTSGQVESTLNHKFWGYKNGVGYGWYISEDLNVGDYISAQAGYNLWGNWDDCSDFYPSQHKGRVNKFEPKILTPDICYFIGLYIAEGCRNNDSSITITCGDDISAILDNFGFTYYKRDKFHYQISSKNLLEFFEYLGINIRNTAKSKIIPKKLLSTTKENISAMLRGMFDGDGCIVVKNGQSKVSYASTSTELIKQVKMLLLNYGIFSSIYQKETPPTARAKVWSYSECLELNARQTLKFNKEIGFGFKRKSDRIINNINIRNGSSFDIIPDAYTFLKNANAKVFCGLTKQKTTNLSRYKLLELKDKLEKNNYYNSQELKKFYNDNVSENIRWEIIKDVSYSENETYDFSLPDNNEDNFAHSIVYNGFIGHQTPAGINHYHKLWKDAVEGRSSFIPIKVTWRDKPGRDEEWRRQTIANTSEEAFIQEHEAEFIGSAGTLIDGWRLKELVEETPIKTGKYAKMYEAVQENHIYIVVADVSRGKGIDNSAYIVVDVTTLPYKIVSTYYCAVVPPDMFAEFIYQAHIYYNDAYVVVENNDAGCETLRVLNDTYECESILGTMTDTQNRKVISINGGNGFEFGVRTTKTVKAVGCTRAKQLVESGSIQFGDRWLIDELNKFIRVGKSYEAQKDAHDDIAMCLVIFSWLTTQYLFEDLTTIDTRFSLRNMKETEFIDDLIPFGYVTDGLDSYGDDTRVDFQSIELPDYADTEFYRYIQNNRKLAEESDGFFDD